ncbi:MAG: hypothetical protein Q9219_006252 [cf. Caloplaca sp. 3 TL-2023]
MACHISYSIKEFNAPLRDICDLLRDYRFLESIPFECEQYKHSILLDIADALDFLLNMGPSPDLDQERDDLWCLTNLSQQLLEIDNEAITSVIWILINRKTTYLSNRLSAPPRLRRTQNVNFAEVLKKARHTPRRDEQRNLESDNECLDTIVVDTSLVSRYSVSDFDVVERVPKEGSSAPKHSVSDFDVVERIPGKVSSAPKTSVSDFDVIERVPKELTSAPKASVSDFDVVERATRDLRIDGSSEVDWEDIDD